jgi:hypothetical protein
MELTELPLPRELWAATPAAAQALIVALQSRIRDAERLLTVAATCQQQGRPLLAFLVAAEDAALHGTAASLLPPTPQGV